MSADTQPRIGIIGGSGFYSFFEPGARQVTVDTPYGDPSAAITIGDVDGVPVAFLPRHGLSHEYAPHTVPYRANAWALRSVGVRRILAPCAVGGLDPELEPGTMVIPDQLVDRTSGRAQTFFDGPAVHVEFADPYCPTLRQAVATAAPEAVVDGTMVVVQGPRFSTRAESRAYASQGFTLINMTGQPEAVLARELQMCYASVALVTDTDAGLVAGDGVMASQVFAVFQEGLSLMRDVLTAAIGEAARQPECRCAQGEHEIASVMNPIS